MRSYAAKRDKYESFLVEKLREENYQVTLVSAKDIPDLFISKNGKGLWIEVKTHRGKMTKGQIEFFKQHRGLCYLAILNSEDVTKQIIQINKFFKNT